MAGPALETSRRGEERAGLRGTWWRFASAAAWKRSARAAILLMVKGSGGGGVGQMGGGLEEAECWDPSCVRGFCLCLCFCCGAPPELLSSLGITSG